MSYIMHTKRNECLDFIKRFLKEKQDVPYHELKVEIMRRFGFASYTADNYIRDIVTVGIAKVNHGHIIYIFDQPKPKKKDVKQNE